MASLSDTIENMLLNFQKLECKQTHFDDGTVFAATSISEIGSEDGASFPVFDDDEEFSGMKFRNPYEALGSLHQDEFVDEYIDEFQSLSALISEQSEEQSIGMFVRGLKNEIRSWVRMLNPLTCDQAMDFARNVEVALGFNKGKSPSKSANPTVTTYPYQLNASSNSRSNHFNYLAQQPNTCGKPTTQPSPIPDESVPNELESGNQENVGDASIQNRHGSIKTTHSNEPYLGSSIDDFNEESEALPTLIRDHIKELMAGIFVSGLKNGADDRVQTLNSPVRDQGKDLVPVRDYILTSDRALNPNEIHEPSTGEYSDDNILCGLQSALKIGAHPSWEMPYTSILTSPAGVGDLIGANVGKSLCDGTLFSVDDCVISHPNLSFLLFPYGGTVRNFYKGYESSQAQLCKISPTEVGLE